MLIQRFYGQQCKQINFIIFQFSKIDINGTGMVCVNPSGFSNIEVQLSNFAFMIPIIIEGTVIEGTLKAHLWQIYLWQESGLDLDIL